MSKVRMYSDSRMTVYSHPRGVSVPGYCVREVSPVKYHGGRVAKLVLYSKLHVDLMTRETLEENLSRVNSKEHFTVMETPTFFIVQYGNRCPVLINRETGRMMTMDGLGYTREEQEHQSSILIEILKKMGYVDRIVYKNMQEGERC